jgi:hypothetical protein
MKISISSNPDKPKPLIEDDITDGFANMQDVLANANEDLLYAGDFTGREMVIKFLNETKNVDPPYWTFIALEHDVDDSISKMRTAFSRIRNFVKQHHGKTTKIRMRKIKEEPRTIEGIRFIAVTIEREDTIKKKLGRAAMEILQTLDIEDTFDEA